MANNLDASIGIDTKKLTADIAVAKQQFTQAGKEFADALKKGASTAQIDLLSGAVDTAKKHLIDLQRTATVGYAEYGKAATEAAKASAGLAKSNKAVEESSRGATREVLKLSREFGNLEFTAFNAAKAFREFPKVAIPLAVAAGAVAAAGKSIEDAAARIEKVENLHQATGMVTADIVAWEKAFRGANVEAAKFDPMIRKLSEDFNKAHLGAAGMETALAGGANVLRGGRPSGESGGVMVLRGGGTQPSQFAAGGAVTVLRGGQPFALKPEAGFAGLVDPSQFAATAKGFNDWLAAVQKVLAGLQRTPQGRALATELARTAAPGMPPEETLRVFGGATPEGLAGARTATRTDPRLLPEAGPLAEKFGVATKEAAEAAASVETRTGVSMMEKTTQGLQHTAEGLGALDRVLEGFRNWKPMAVETAPQVENFQQELTNATAAMSSFTSAVGSAIQQLQSVPMTPAAAPGGAMTLPYASGGPVPGHGDGDTVPAMLTPGEFVNRKSSVGYYGAGLFRALNSMRIPRELFQGFAYGGLVDSFHTSPQHFANGGVVASAGTTPVAFSLHLSGQQFLAHMSAPVAARLVQEARAQSMRSAGIKPSWVS